MPDGDSSQAGSDWSPPPSSRRSSGSGAGRWQPPTPEELQEQIPQFKILDLLGRGGMGAVYQAWQTSLERYVAIKILPPNADDGDEQFTARFKQEAKTMAKFQHPGIVSIYDAGETPNGLLYIVMEFIEGTDVAQMVKSQGKLLPEHALAITAHVCDALQYAHSHGVIHRDIKPANVLMNLEGSVKVADFGLAKAAGPAQGGLTKNDVAMGTPDYVSPEALITGIEIDGRADLYAVGVMLYNMLTGQVPRGLFEMPSVRTGGETDVRFDAIITRAMDPDRETRYQSAAEIRRDLDVILTTPKLVAQGTGSSAIPKQELAVMRQGLAHKKPVAKRPGALVRQPQVVTFAPEKRSVLPAVAAGVVLAAAAFFAWQKFGRHSLPAGGAPASDPSPAQLSTGFAASSAQPEGVLTFDGHRYKFLPGPFMKDEDRDRAAALKGHLVTITSAEEQKWIEQTFASVISVNSRGLCRTGGIQADDGKLSWTNGEPWGYTNWDTGFPVAKEHMGILVLRQADGALKWQNIYWSEKRSALIEWDDATTPIPPAALFAPLASAKPAPADALAFGGHRYQLVRGDIPWDNAKAQAEQMGGHLATITSAEEDEWVRATFIESLPDEKLLHIGGQRLNDSESWAWVTGEPWSYTRWRKSATKNPGGIGYMKAIAENERGWNGWGTKTSPAAQNGPLKGLSRVEGFLVEWDQDTVPPAPAPAPALAFGGHRYSLVPDRTLTWTESKAAAAAMHGHLATVTSKEENDWIASTFIAKLDRGLGLWIGGTDEGSPGKWRWLTREPFTFSAWGVDEPSNNSGEPGILFANTDAGTLTWADMPENGTGRIDRRAGFLVEWDQDTVPGATLANGAAAAGPPINLLAGVDVKRDAVKGDWEMKQEGLVVRENTGAKLLSFSQAAPAEYDFEIEFTIAGGKRDLNQVLPVPGGVVLWKMGFGSGEQTPFSFGPSLDGKSPSIPVRSEAAVERPRLKAGQRYRSRVEVRRGSLRALLDGGEVLRWSGDFKRLSIPPGDGAPDPTRPGLGAWETGITFHKAELRPASDLAQRLAQIESQFKEAYERDVTKSSAGKAIADLDRKYLAAIGRALADATKAGSLDDVTALQAEKKRVTEKAALPAADPVNIVTSLANLRSTYRKAVAPLIKKRDATADPVYERYDQALASFQSELTQKHATGDAEIVKTRREALAQERRPATAEPMIAAAAPQPNPAPAPSKPAESTAKKDSPKKDAAPATLPPEMLNEPVPKPFTPQEAMQWALSLGGVAKIKKGSVESEVLSAAKMPKSSFSVIGLKIGDKQPLHVVSLAALSGLTELRELKLDNNLITDAGLAFLPKLPKLTHLSLNSCGLTDAGLAQLAKEPSLNRLGLGNNHINGSGLRELVALQSLDTLEIGSAALADENILALASFSALATLDLSGDKPLTCADLSPLAGIKSLKRIILGKAATDKVVQSLGSLVQLDTLDLNRAPISDYALDRIGSMKGLRELNFYGCPNLTDVGFAKLQPLKGLLKLNVGRTRLTDSQFVTLSTKLPELTEINLTADGVSDAGLAGLPNLRKLARLSVHVRMCTDLGMGYVRRLANLRVIGIEQIETLNQARFEALKRALPGCDFGKR